MPLRKATESIADVVIGTPRRRQNSPMFVAGLILAGIVVIGGAVMIGKSDTGPINVAATIQESNKVAESEGREQVQTVSPEVQNLPNGGLIPQSNQPTETPAPTEQETSISSTTATTTEETTLSGEGVLSSEQTENTDETPEASIE